MPKRASDYHSWLLRQLTNPIAAASYINAAIEGSPEMLPVALRNVAEAKRISKVAEDAGVNRETLYRTLSEEGNPTLRTLNSVLAVLGLRLGVEAEHCVPENALAAPVTTLIQNVAMNSEATEQEKVNNAPFIILVTTSTDGYILDTSTTREADEFQLAFVNGAIPKLDPTWSLNANGPTEQYACD